MPRGGYRPGAGGSVGRGVMTIRKDDPPELVAAKKLMTITKHTPLSFMLEVINDPVYDVNLRLRAAACAAPYVHARKQDEGIGKKERDIEKAHEAAVGKFQPRDPPGIFNKLN